MNQQNNQPVRRSRRLATIIPASNWISIGYSEDDARRMETLQNDMKKYCEGDGETGIELVGADDDEMLPHHDMLLPHWQKFANELRGRNSVDSCNIFGISLPISVLDIILPSLQTMNLAELALIDVNLRSDEFLRLSSFLRDSTSINRFVIGGDAIDLSIATSLSDTIKDHPSLEGVGFYKCGLNNVPVLETILQGCTRSKCLGISFETLGLDSINVITDFIRCNHSVDIIQLGHNNLSNSDVAVLASALKGNSNLKQLDLQNNDITEEGEKVRLDAMYNPTSMDSIVESNHTCIPHTYDIYDDSAINQRPILEQELFNINVDDDISIQQKIRKKVVLALCGGADGSLFDLSHLNDLPLQLMPRVLELLQEHTEIRTNQRNLMPEQLEKDALTRLFHTLRGWELPLLFDNLRTQVPTGKRKRRKTCHYH